MAIAPFCFGARADQLNPPKRGALLRDAACRFGKSPRFIHVSRRFPVNRRAIACRMCVSAGELRGACADDVSITFRRFAHSRAQFPNVLTLAPVNPHHCRTGADERVRVSRDAACRTPVHGAGLDRGRVVGRSAYRQPRTVRLCFEFAQAGRRLVEPHPGPAIFRYRMEPM